MIRILPERKKKHVNSPRVGISMAVCTVDVGLL